MGCWFQRLGPVISFCLVQLAGCHSLPHGQTGADADALAHRIERAVHAEDWPGTGSIRFTFRNGTEHLWDKTRNLDRIHFRGSDEVVLLDVAQRNGRAYKKGRELAGDARRKLIERAWERFCNDTFWLNPLVKLFDGGVTRSRVVNKDGESLIVHYSSGGATPGDTYQWLLGMNDRPRAWRLFVKIIRIRGLEFTWQDWTSLPTGPSISTEHKALGIAAVRLTGVARAATRAELQPGPDPFAPHFDGLNITRGTR